MNRTASYVIIGIGIAVVAVLYFLQNPQSGPQTPTGSSGSGSGLGTGGTGSSCGADVCLGIGSDGSSDPVSVSPQAQTEGAYNVAPTDTSAAFGPSENNDGSDLISI